MPTFCNFKRMLSYNTYWTVSKKKVRLENSSVIVELRHNYPYLGWRFGISLSSCLGIYNFSHIHPCICKYNCSLRLPTKEIGPGVFALRSPINEMQISIGETQIIMGLQEDHSCILLCISRCSDDPAIISQLVLALFFSRWTTIRHARF